MKNEIMKKAAKIVNVVAEMGGGPICLGWSYQPPRPECQKTNVKTSDDSCLTTDKK